MGPSATWIGTTITATMLTKMMSLPGNCMNVKA